MDLIELDKNIEKNMNKIFYDLQKYNFNYDKKILLFTNTKTQEITLNDYIFFFFTTMNIQISLIFYLSKRNR